MATVAGCQGAAAFALAPADVARDATVASSCRILYRLAADKELAKAGLREAGRADERTKRTGRAFRGLFRSVRTQERRQIIERIIHIKFELWSLMCVGVNVIVDSATHKSTLL